MVGVLRDLTHAARALRKAPAFTLAAIAVLGLGVGANTSLFSVVYGVLLRPLPFESPERLVQLWHTPPQKSFPGVPLFSLSAANYLDWEKQSDVFDLSAVYEYSGYHLGGDKPELVDAARTQATLFQVLGVKALLGRPLGQGDDEPGHGKVTVLSHKLWKSRFNGDAGIIGRDLSLDGESYTVVGVMPPSFQLPDWAALWTPLVWAPDERAVRGEHHFQAVGRLKPSVTLGQAQAQLSAIADRLAQEYPADNAGWGAKLVPLRDELVGAAREPLLVLFGAVAFVLLIACANVGNLMLAKTLDRRKEIAIRTALGASRGRILRHVLSEALLLSLAGGAVGMLLAHYGTDLIVSYLGSKLPRMSEISVDGWVLAFTLGISVLTGALAGGLPAWRLSHADPADAMKQGLGRMDSSSGGMRTRSALVVVEVALSLVLLVGAGLMIRTLSNLRAVSPGFDSSHGVTMTVAPSPTDYTTPAQEVAFFRDVMAGVTALPGVEATGVADNLPLSGGGSMQPIAIQGHAAAAMADQPEVSVRRISPGYLRAMRIPVLQGRDFTAADDPSAQAAILVSESFAKRFWPGESAVGKRLTMTFFPDKVREVIGVIGDVKHVDLAARDPEPTLYAPIAQLLGPTEGFQARPLELVVRTNGTTQVPVASLLSAIHAVKSDTPVVNISTLEQRVAESLLPQRFNMLLLAAFAALALVLAAVGIYSVLAYAVRQRTREMGIRLALGAQGRDVLRMVLLDGLRPVLLGLGIGLAAALALAQVVSALVYGVNAIDGVSFGVAALVLVLVGVAASLVPAYRATRVDPLESLREE